jgi:acid phosphatase type 7
MPVLTRRVSRLRGAWAAGLLMLALILHISCGGGDSIEPPRAVVVRIVPSTPISLLAGESYQLKATPTDARGSDLPGIKISWSSGDSSVATVEDGLVTGIMPGSAPILASADSASGETSVTVLAQVARLVINPPFPTLLPGDTLQLAANAEDAWGGPIEGRAVLWTTDDPTVATVSDAGVVTAVHPGSGAVSATVSNKTASVTVLVLSPVSALDISPDSATLHPRDMLQFTATSRDVDGGIIDGRPIQWTVSDLAIASVNDAGIVTAKRLGTALLTADVEGQRGTARLKVQAAVRSVLLSPDRGTLRIGATLQLEVTLKDENGNSVDGREVSWTTDHPEVATVSASGLVKAVRVGQVMVTAKSEGKEGRSTITVEEAVARVVVTPASRRLVLGEVFRFSASPRAADGDALSGREVEWSSDRPNIATVSKDGRVTALAEGTAQIEASSEGVDGHARVDVWQPTDQPVVFVGAGDIATCAGQGDEQTARLLDRIAGVVFVAGDNAYPDGTEAEYANCYDPTWGRHKSRTRPVPGNREYLTPNASGYFNYFGSAAGNPATGYYSYDLGAWHVLALNTQFTGKEGSPQAEWVKADLAAHPKKCTLAIWHVPLFGPDSASARMRPVFDLLHKAGAELVINGHEHSYQRFAPQTAFGVADPERGVREFVVGTGGKGVGASDKVLPNREVAYGGGFGVLELKLYQESYSWEFISVAGKTFSDSGSATCH